METKSVYLKELADVLRTIKAKKLPVKIYNHSGQWSEHFFGVLEVKEINVKGYQVTVLVLFDPETNDSTAIDVKSINLIELQSQLEFDGTAVKKLKVQK
jgi:hypothetical protein